MILAPGTYHPRHERSVEESSHDRCGAGRALAHGLLVQTLRQLRCYFNDAGSSHCYGGATRRTDARTDGLA